MPSCRPPAEGPGRARGEGGGSGATPYHSPNKKKLTRCFHASADDHELAIWHKIKGLANADAKKGEKKKKKANKNRGHRGEAGMVIQCKVGRYHIGCSSSKSKVRLLFPLKCLPTVSPYGNITDALQENYVTRSSATVGQVEVQQLL